MKSNCKFLFIFIAFIFLFGCAPSVQTSIDTLELSQKTIVSLATCADNMCSAGTLDQAQCDKAAKLYNEAKGAYANVLIAEELVIDAVIAGAEQQGAEELRIETITVWTSIATKFVTLAVEYGIIGEE